MRKFAAFALPLLLVLAIGSAGCGKNSTPSGNTVQMTSDNFATTSVTITAGGTVIFADPPAGAVHILCLGHNQTCNSSITGGPPELSSGKTLEIDSGQKSVTFPNKGDFEVTCTVHQIMNTMVHVH